MKTAFAVWNNRIAPVFDVARRVIIVESKTQRGAAQTQVLLAGDLPLQKVQQLAELGADSLVCGAISRSLEAVLTARGIRVVSYVAGNVQNVIDAWRTHHLEVEGFAMPGRRRRSNRMVNRHKQEEAHMGVNQGGGRRVGGRGQGRQGHGGKFTLRPDQSVTETPGECVCTQCGHIEAHVRGNSCIQKKCPQCGAVMLRK